MITVLNLKFVLEKKLGFTKSENEIYIKHFDKVDCDLKVDFKNKKLIYPTNKHFEVNDGTTSNFEHPENFVVFECVNRLFEKGYRPEHIELEPRWSLGHGGKSGKADICVKNKDGTPYLFIIECKTPGTEYNKEKQNMKANGGQLFSYWQQSKATKWLILYTSDFDEVNSKITHIANTVNCSDDANFIELAKDDKSLKLYKDATTVETLYEVWKETYEQKFLGDVIFDDETVAYDIGILPLKKKRLVDFSRDDKIVNQFEEILRHNNVSDKENAFNRLIALFIAKLYDEKKKSLESEVDFQYKSGTDTYQKMQDRLQKLHYLGMKEFMKEDVFYVPDDYVKTIVKENLGEQRENLEAELNKTITKLKFYTNNDFSFKDVHNRILFYQNGKILVEMVELFQKYKLVDSNELQLLGDMFEQLLNKGFKQNEGQFFTPIPITCFIWKCLPLDSIIIDEEKNEVHYPKVIDYSCGAGHFLTEGFREINETVSLREKEYGIKAERGWERDCIYGIEKDYRLARVSKISMFMHGADNGNIVFGDGLDNHNKDGIVIENGQFDILVANPPYSVSAFKNHLELKNNKLNLLDYISKDGKEIETLFVERIAQLLKPNGIAAVILPSSILSNSSTSYIKAREEILKNFAIHSIVQFSSKTFGATGTNTVVLYLRKNKEPPVKSESTHDIVTSIFNNDALSVENDKDVFENYCKQIKVTENAYREFIKDSDANANYSVYINNEYFGQYAKEYEQSSDYKTALKQDERLKSKDGTEHLENRNKAFYNYVLAIEKDKVYCFALVYKQIVLVVTAPIDDKDQEKFLGYTWSNRKGDEGIKIKSSNPQKSCGLLYNVYDEENSIARFVKDSFLDIYRNGTESGDSVISKYIVANSLKDMIDFSRTTFDKSIKTNVQGESGKFKIESKYPLKTVENILIDVGGNKTKIDKDKILKTGKYPVITQESGKFISGYTNNSDCITDLPLIVFGDHSCSFKYVDFPFVRGADGTQLLKTNQNEVITKYLYYYLSSIKIENSERYERHFKYLKTTKIPIPESLDIQKSIVKECEEIDTEYQNTQQSIIECKNQIYKIMMDSKGETKKLKEICDMKAGKFVSANEIFDNQKEDMYPCFGGNGLRGYTKDFTHNGVFPLVGRQGALCGNVCLATGKFHATEHAVVVAPYENINVYWLYYELEYLDLNQYATGTAQPGLSVNKILEVTCNVPSLAEQEKIISQIIALESQISEAKQIMVECPKKKQAILDKWLR